MSHHHKAQIVKALAGITVLLLSSCVANNQELTRFKPEHISCTDQSTPEIIQKAEHDFGRLESGNPNSDAMHPSAQEMQWWSEALHSTKRLADSGNPYGMGVFGHMQAEMLMLAYLDEKHIYSEKEAAELTLPDSRKADMVTALSYLYIATTYEDGDIKERSQKVIDTLKHPDVEHSKMGYVKIPANWFNEAKANASGWKAKCLKE